MFSRPGTFSTESQTSSSEVSRPLIYTGIAILVNVVIGLFFILLSIVVGRAYGLILLAIACFYGINEVHITRCFPYFSIALNHQRVKEDKFWFLFVGGVVFTLLWATGQWWPLRWSWGGGQMWLAYWDGAVGVSWAGVWVRALFIALLPVAWKPVGILKWVLVAESVFPNYRNVSFGQANPEDVFQMPRHVKAPRALSRAQREPDVVIEERPASYRLGGVRQVATEEE